MSPAERALYFEELGKMLQDIAQQYADEKLQPSSKKEKRFKCLK